MSLPKQLWFFNEVNLFNVMCPHKLKGFGAEGHFKAYDKGQSIYFTGDASSTIYLVTSGKVRIVNYNENGNEVVKAILGRGEIFGELAILGQDIRDEVAEAMSDDVVVCPVHKEQIHDLMKENKEFSFTIHKWLGLRLQKMERRIDALVFKDVRQRLIEFIADLAKDNGQKNDQGQTVIAHFYTHKNIANLIGTSRQTVTTTLNQLRDEGLLDFNRKTFTLLKENAF
jgi:CRP-like cAMP-binding protein